MHTNVLSTRRLYYVALHVAFAACAAYLVLPAPARAAYPECSAEHNTDSEPALGFEHLPHEIAYGRKIDFSVAEHGEEEVNGEDAYRYRTDEPAELTMQGNREQTPYVDSEKNLAGQEYSLQPSRAEGNSTTVSIAFDEEYLGPELESAVCRRTVTQVVRFVKGRAPKLVTTKEGRDLTLHVRTYGEQCSQTALGKLVLFVSGPGGKGRLVLSDVCNGRWSKRVKGSEWAFYGLLNPCHALGCYLDTDGAADFGAYFERNGSYRATIRAKFARQRWTMHLSATIH